MIILRNVLILITVGTTAEGDAKDETETDVSWLERFGGHVVGAGLM